METGQQINRDAEKAGLPLELSLSALRTRPASPLNDRVWRLLVFVSAGCLVAWLIPSLLGSRALFLLWVSASLLVASWVLAIRMLLLDSRAKKFWVVWLIVGSLPLINLGTKNLAWVSVFFSFVFLLFRRYRPFRHLTSRRQGWLFLIGVVLFFLTFGWPSFTMSVKADIASATEVVPAA